jgi:hypothetical protein
MRGSRGKEYGPCRRTGGQKLRRQLALRAGNRALARSMAGRGRPPAPLRGVTTSDTPAGSLLTSCSPVGPWRDRSGTATSFSTPVGETGGTGATGGAACCGLATALRAVDRAGDPRTQARPALTTWWRAGITRSVHGRPWPAASPAACVTISNTLAGSRLLTSCSPVGPWRDRSGTATSFSITGAGEQNNHERPTLCDREALHRNWSPNGVVFLGEGSDPFHRQKGIRARHAFTIQPAWRYHASVRRMPSRRSTRGE